MGNAEFYIRLTILRRVLPGDKLPSGEPVEVFPEPDPGTGKYSAKQVALNAGEEIRQGVKEGTSFIRLEIKGRNIPVAHFDRIRLEPSGDIYRVTAPPVRLRRTTQLSCESV